MEIDIEGEIISNEAAKRNDVRKYFGRLFRIVGVNEEQAEDPRPENPRMKRMLEARDKRAREICSRCQKPGHISSNCRARALEIREKGRANTAADGFPIRKLPPLEDPEDLPE